jgi:hypothetical protein
MYNNDTDLLFPSRVIPSLRKLRSQTWRDLVEQVLSQDGQGTEQLAFVLMMVRLGGCTSCQADSYRALQGCTLCARQTVRRFQGNDEALVALFTKALQDIERLREKKARQRPKHKSV